MEERNFEEDLIRSNNPILLKNWERCFIRIFGDGCSIQWKERNREIQMGLGLDATVTTKKGRRYSVEVKTRSNKYYQCENYLLEIAHHRYSDRNRNLHLGAKPGWLYTGTFEIILYGTLNPEGDDLIEVCGFTSVPFKDENFKSKLTDLKNAWAKTVFSNGELQLTLNKMVSMDFLRQYAGNFWYWRGE